ncbi:MAG: hypothetical protein ACR2JS_07480 [Candidatus Nanopelagicales bacterium]
MSRVRALSASIAALGVCATLALTGCSNSSTTAEASSASPAASAGASALASAPSDAASSAASAGASELAADPSPIPSNLSKAAFCLLTAPLYDKKALPANAGDSEAGVVLAAKRLIKGTQALSQAERLKALTAKQVAELQVTMAIFLTMLQNPALENGTVDEMAKASGVDAETLKIAQTKEFQDESAAAFVELGNFCA